MVRNSLSIIFPFCHGLGVCHHCLVCMYLSLNKSSRGDKVMQYLQVLLFSSCISFCLIQARLGFKSTSRTRESWCRSALHHGIQKFSGSHFGLPPSPSHRMTGWVAISRELWHIRTGPLQWSSCWFSWSCLCTQRVIRTPRRSFFTGWRGQRQRVTRFQRATTTSTESRLCVFICRTLLRISWPWVCVCVCVRVRVCVCVSKKDER